MPGRPLTYHRPTDFATAQQLLSQPHTVPLAFGPRVPNDVYGQAEAVVDLSQLGLNYIRVTDSAMTIGAYTPLQSILDAPAIHPLLAEAIGVAAPLTIRHLATLGGAWTISDGPPEIKLALLALGVEVRPTEFALPREAAVSGALERVARAPRDEAIVAVVATVCAENGVVQQVRVAVAGAHPQPIRLPAVETVLIDQPLTLELLQRAEVIAMNESQPIADFRASADYRRAMAGVLTRRALATAWKQATA